MKNKGMGMHKMGQVNDTPSQGFMNPTVTRQGVQGKGNMGSMRQNQSHAHMNGMRHSLRGMKHAHMTGQKKDLRMGKAHMGRKKLGLRMGMAHMGHKKALPGKNAAPHAHMGMKLPKAHRRIGRVCAGLQGLSLGRCRAKLMGGCVGLTGQALMGCKAQRRKLRKSILGGSWILAKKPNGKCECTQQANGMIVLGRYK